MSLPHLLAGEDLLGLEAVRLVVHLCLERGRNGRSALLLLRNAHGEFRGHDHDPFGLEKRVEQHVPDPLQRPPVLAVLSLRQNGDKKKGKYTLPNSRRK